MFHSLFVSNSTHRVSRIYFNHVGKFEWLCGVICCVQSKSAREICISTNCFYFFETNINDTRLNILLKWIFFFFLQRGGQLCKPVSGRRTNRLLHGPVNHRLGNQQSPSDRKDAWCFKPLQASALPPPSPLPFHFSCSGSKPLLHDTGHHTQNKNEVRRLEN